MKVLLQTWVTHWLTVILTDFNLLLWIPGLFSTRLWRTLSWSKTYTLYGWFPPSVLTFNYISHEHTLLWSLFSSQDFSWNCGLLRMCLGCCRLGRSLHFAEHGGFKYQGRQTFAPDPEESDLLPPTLGSQSQHCSSHWWFILSQFLLAVTGDFGWSVCLI